MGAGESKAGARSLAGALEPFAGSVYFSPECHERYVALGFSPSAASRQGVALPDGSAYFTSRGSVMGQVPGQLVASAFAVFNPVAVVPVVTHGWTLVDAATICEARTEGAVAQLARILGPRGGRAGGGAAGAGRGAAAPRGSTALRRLAVAGGAHRAAGPGLAPGRPA